MPVGIPGQVIGWVSRNLTQNETPLDGPSGAQRLAFLSGLVDFVEKEEFLVKEGETLVFCPTAILNRVPPHAIPIGGRPLIERNPVIYCQSLTILHWLWKKSTGRTSLPVDPSPKATVINPMPANWPGEDGPGTGPPVLSTPGVQRLASKLGALTTAATQSTAPSLSTVFAARMSSTTTDMYTTTQTRPSTRS